MWQMFDIEAIVHKEFVPPGQTVNGIFCCEVLRRLKTKHPAQTSRQLAQQLLGLASWKRYDSRVACCAAVFGFYEYDSHPPPSLFTGPRPLWFSYSWRRNWRSRGRPSCDIIKEIQTVSQNVMKTLSCMSSRSVFDYGNPARIAV